MGSDLRYPIESQLSYLSEKYIGPCVPDNSTVYSLHNEGDICEQLQIFNGHI